ncbi:phage minor capsid protein [Ruminococcus sp.]
MRIHTYSRITFKGWNCRHDWYPYFEGSTRMYDEEKLKQMEAKNIEYPDGSMYTLYEAEQKQRAYERKIRESKRILAAYDESVKNADDEAIKKAYQNIFNKESVKLKNREAELNNFCDKTGLLKRNDRVQKYGFGRSTAQKAVQANKKAVAKNTKKSIIKSLDIDDFELVTYGKNIAPEVSKVIVDTMTKCESKGKFIISEIVAKSIPKTQDGTPVLQIEPIGNGLLQLNLNTDILSDKTLEEIDEIFANSNLSVVNTLE